MNARRGPETGRSGAGHVGGTGHVGRSDAGQATTEYILLVAVVVGFYLMVAHYLGNFRFGQKISNAMTTPYQSIYTYGYPGAKGFDDGGPQNHPRATSGAGSFRIFINPDKQGG